MFPVASSVRSGLRTFDTIVDGVYFLLNHIRRWMISGSPTTNDVTFGHLINMVATGGKKDSGVLP